MQNQNPLQYDIMVLGLGPVGLLTCNLMGMRGYKVLGVDKLRHSYHFPRAIHIDHEILRIVQSVGLLEELLPKIKPSTGLELMDKNFKVLFKGFQNFPSGFEGSNFMFLQPELEEILSEGCQRFENVQLQYELEIDDLKQTDDLVEIYSKNQSIAKAKYLIASDGAKSFVRSFLGIQTQNLNFQKGALKVDAFEINPSKENFHTVQKICSSRKPYVRMQGVGKHRRWELNYNDGKSKEEIEHRDNVKSMLEEIGVDVSNLEIVHAVYYQFRSLIAKEWRQNRIFLAGDAAHTTPPYIGQGMCSGFRDVMNLCWKMDAVLKQEFPEDILNTYQTERYPHVKILIQKAIGIGYLFTTHWWYLLKLFNFIPFLNKELKRIKFRDDPCGKGFWGNGKKVKRLFPQFKSQDHEFSDYYFQNQWALLSMGIPFSQEIKRMAEETGLKLVLIREDEHGMQVIRQWAKKEINFYIIRPDLYVYACGNNPERLCKEIMGRRLKPSLNKIKHYTTV